MLTPYGLLAGKSQRMFESRLWLKMSFLCQLVFSVPNGGGLVHAFFGPPLTCNDARLRARTHIGSMSAIPVI